MSAATHLAGLILTPAGWLRGALTLADGRITTLRGDPVDDDAWRAGAEPLLLPGFIDLHVHGGGGADTDRGCARGNSCWPLG